MICVLDVTAGPARGRRFWLRSDQQVEIGRLSSADFAIPADPHMSRRHLILEGTHSAFRVRDVGSANGTYVNDAKVSSVELCSGDRIRVGETTFEVSVIDDNENPHAKDGLAFSSSASRSSIFPAARSSASSQSWQPAASISQPSLDDMAALQETSRDSVSAPMRSLQAADPGTADAEITRRCRPVSPPANPALPRDSHHGTVLSNNSWWSDFQFLATDVPCLLKEVGRHEPSNSLLPEILRRIEPEYVLTAIIDVQRLGRSARQQLTGLVEQGSVTWHAPSVCTVVDNRGRDFPRMIESALFHDAVTIIGSRTQLNADWLQELVAQTPRPSVLDHLLQAPQSALISFLLSNVEFVIFEHDREGHLSLLLRDLIELSD